MRKFFFKIFLILIFNIVPLKTAYSEIFIVAKVNEEIITNLDLDFEKKYLVSLNPNLNKLDKNRITEYAKDSLINERIKKIEINRVTKISINETLLSKVVTDIYSSIGISTTGNAGPSKGDSDAEVGTVWIAIAKNDRVYSEKFIFGKNR